MADPNALWLIDAFDITPIEEAMMKWEDGQEVN